MKLLTSVLLSGLALAMPTAASAQSSCEPEFVGAGQSVVFQDIIIGRDDFTVENFQVRIRNGSGDNGPCATTVRIARLASSPTLNPTPFTLQSRGQALQILPRENAPGSSGSDLSIPQVPSGRNGFSLPFQLGVPSGWGARSGSQTEDLLILLVDDLGRTVDTLPLTIQIVIPPAAEVRVVGPTGTNSIARIDLGRLDPTKTNLSERFGIRVWSTSAYTVQFQSQNQGELVHSENRGRIPYELLMDQRPVSAVGGIAKQVPNGTDALGEVHPLIIRVRPFSERAGDYSDRVQVTVTAR